MSSVIKNGTIYPNVEFVDSPEDAILEIVYDNVEYDKEKDTWLYFYRGYLVATTLIKKVK